MITPRSRAHRILKKMKYYKEIFVDEENIRSPALFVLDKNEEVIGIYNAEPEDKMKSVIFTSLGLIFYSENLYLKVLYREIGRCICPEQKTLINGFNIIKIDGENLFIPISGIQEGKYYDAFEVLRFLDRVIVDLRSERSLVEPAANY